MSDFIFVVLFLGFMAACVAYVALCERVVGNDDPTGAAEARR